MPDTHTVEHYVDAQSHDCYRICLAHGPCSTVSSAHLIDERVTQLLRLYPAPCSKTTAGSELKPRTE